MEMTVFNWLIILIGPIGESKVATLCGVFKFFHRMGGEWRNI
jgi:hypothetical protein